MPMNREEALDFKHNENWKKLCEELDKLIKAESDKLLNCPVEDCIGIREKIKALRFCVKLPDIIAEREE